MGMPISNGENRRLLCAAAAGTGLLVALAPVAIGCVHIVTYSAMELLVFLLLSLNLWAGGWSCDGEESIRRYRRRTLLLASPLLAFLAIALLQMIPLPIGFVRKISPNTVAFYSHLGIAGDLGGSSDVTWAPLSISLSATSGGLLKWTAYVAAFFLAAAPLKGSGGKPPWAKGTLIVFFVLGVFEAVYGLSLYENGSYRLLWFARSHEANCVAGTYVNRNHFPGLMNICMPISGTLLALNLQRMPGWRLRQALFNPRLFRTWSTSYLLLGGMVVMVLALIFSMSRMGQFSMIAAAVFAVLLYVAAGLREKERRGRRLALVLLVAMALGFLWGTWKGLGPVEQRWKAVGASYEERSVIWRAAVKMIKEFPLGGVGLGAFSLAFPPYKTEKFNGITVDHAHNDYLEVLSEVGLAGFIPWMTFFLSFLLFSVRAWLRLGDSSLRLLAVGCLCAVVATLIHGLTDFNLQIPANAMLLFIAMGLGWKMVNTGYVTNRRECCIT